MKSVHKYFIDDEQQLPAQASRRINDEKNNTYDSNNNDNNVNNVLTDINVNHTTIAKNRGSNSNNNNNNNTSTRSTSRGVQTSNLAHNASSLVVNGENDKNINVTNTKYLQTTSTLLQRLNNTVSDDATIRGSDSTASPPLSSPKQNNNLSKLNYAVQVDESNNVNEYKRDNENQNRRDDLGLQRTPSEVRGTTWYEPDLSNLLDTGDTTPIDDPALP